MPASFDPIGGPVARRLEDDRVTFPINPDRVAARWPENNVAPGAIIRKVIGRDIAHYRVLQELGRGGMGEVYLAEDTKLRRKVALKILPAQFGGDPARRKRFVREAIAASVLSHPNVAVVYEAGETEDGAAFISLEHVTGETLLDVLERRRLSVPEIVEIATQVADALDEARHHGIVHRDLKPGNIMLDQRGRVKLLDFGIAKIRERASDAAADDATAVRETELGTLIGTVDYMSPEQAQGRAIDHRSDLFSLGVVLYEMVSGKRPFSGRTPLETLSRIGSAQPERITPIRKDCPAELERIIFRCLEKDAESRYQSARELLLDLQGVARQRGGRVPRFHRGAMRFGIAALVVVALAAIVLSLTRPSQKPAPPPARPRLESVAVLPFINMSPESEDETFADGLTDEIINALAQVPDLKVVSRTSVFAFKGKNADVREIGRRLGVESTVEGSVRRSGTKLRVTAQLIETDNGYHLWSHTYDRELSDVFAIQDEIARAVARALQAQLNPGQKLVSEPTRDVVAYELYLKGRQASTVWTRDSLDQSVEYFRQAIARDPSFASAYGGLAEAYSLMDHTQQGALAARGAAVSSSLNSSPPDDHDEIYRLAIAAAGRALELDPDSVEAHAALAHIFIHQLRFADAERHLKRALELNPNSVSALQWYSLVLNNLGRPRESLEQILEARELDPLSVQVNSLAASRFLTTGDLDQTIDALQRGIGIAPEYGPFYLDLATAHALKGNHAEAAKILGQAARLPDPPADLDERRAMHLALANRRSEALSLLEKIAREEEHPSGRTMALAHAVLGENEKAVLWLRRFVRENPNYARLNLNIPPYPPFESLRRDPRYHALRKQVGLPVSE